MTRMTVEPCEASIEASSGAAFDSSCDYWIASRRPLPSLVFLAPLLVAYEAGVLWFHSAAQANVRNGADHWMRVWLSEAGLHQTWLLPALVTLALIAWHFLGRHPHRVAADTLVGMVAESLLFAFCLIALGQVQDLVFQKLGPTSLAMWSPEAAANLIGFVGAGIYEEFLFRLCLLPMVFYLLRLVNMPVAWAAVLAVILTSVMFSSAHYVGAPADIFSIYGFLFRAIAGVFFAALFMLRGFGITVGCHAAYDVLVGIILVSHQSEGP